MTTNPKRKYTLEKANHTVAFLRALTKEMSESRITRAIGKAADMLESLASQLAAQNSYVHQCDIHSDYQPACPDCMKGIPEKILAAQKREGELPNPIDDLVDRFAEALRKKLHEAEAKYGYDHGFQRKDWRDACVEHLHLHLAKGDPRDVAAYCAFAWNHGWSLANQPPSPDQDREVSP